MDYDFSYLDFIAKHHPKYYSDDRVLLCDILFRFLTDDEVSTEDLNWLQKEYTTKSEVLEELKRLETLLFSETLDYFYESIINPT
ncbi:MAG TPA: 6-phospho-beta-glucosidase [Prevotellaceae bacterium]|nr:6-phospho-beta-glucosidase [Prevotellaceae bacterium]